MRLLLLFSVSICRQHQLELLVLAGLIELDGGPHPGVLEAGLRQGGSWALV